MSLLRIRAQNAINAVAVRSANYWNRAEFHTEDVVVDDDGEEIVTRPLLFSAIEGLALSNTMASLGQVVLLAPVFLGCSVLLLFHSDEIPSGMHFLGALLPLFGFLLTAYTTLNAMRFTQLCATMDADGVYDDVFDTGPGIGVDNDYADEGDEEPIEDAEVDETEGFEEAEENNVISLADDDWSTAS